MKKYESIRIFENPILESMTHVHPVIPILMWAPVVVFLYLRSHAEFQLDVITTLAILVSGLLTWTLVEYLLHRYVFHFPAKGPLGKRFVFLFHGLHHDDPNDPTRLVMPPVPAMILAVILYSLAAMLVPSRFLDAFFASFMIGYLCYDYIHYATHHFPMTSKLGRFLKVYHLKHHHQHAPGRFGVSSPLWDYVFSTTSEELKKELA